MKMNFLDLKMNYLKYRDHLQYLSAILTIAMICFQGVPLISGTIENIVLNGHNDGSQLLTDNLTKDQLNNMTVSELNELNIEVKQELKQKYMETPNNNTLTKVSDLRCLD